MGFAGLMSNQKSTTTDSWQLAGDTASYQIYTTGLNKEATAAYYLRGESDASVVDASFIRLKNISLSYEIPLHLKETNCKIMLQAQNLLTFTPYKDGDPEFSIGGYLPPLKVISTGVQFTF